MKNRILAFMVSLVVIASLGWAHTPIYDIENDPQVREGLKLIEIWVDAQMAYRDIPGMSIGIVDDQKLIWSRGFGFAHKDEKIAATP